MPTKAEKAAAKAKKALKALEAEKASSSSPTASTTTSPPTKGKKRAHGKSRDAGKGDGEGGSAEAEVQEVPVKRSKVADPSSPGTSKAEDASKDKPDPESKPRSYKLRGRDRLDDLLEDLPPIIDITKFGALIVKLGDDKFLDLEKLISCLKYGMGDQLESEKGFKDRVTTDDQQSVMKITRGPVRHLRDFPELTALDNLWNKSNVKMGVRKALPHHTVPLRTSGEKPKKRPQRKYPAVPEVPDFYPINEPAPIMIPYGYRPYGGGGPRYDYGLTDYIRPSGGRGGRGGFGRGRVPYVRREDRDRRPAHRRESRRRRGTSSEQEEQEMEK